MRISIESTDRIGISQEILAVFAQQAWNLKAVEITSCFTYAQIEQEGLQLADVQKSLSGVSGIVRIKEIALLPAQQRENHLQALLDKIPEPIIDLGKHGEILAVNQATKLLIKAHESERDSAKELDYIGKPIADYIKPLTKNLITDSASSHAITINSKAYIADFSPVYASTFDENKQTNQAITGAVVVLRSMHTLGRQISLIQTHHRHDFNAIIGQSNEIVLIKEQSKRFAELDLPVLINGETGTGKELIARALHQASPRAKSPFLALNCAALPEHLLESELFGYTGGAFTGAQKGGKPGLIELAEGGSLFLDEIAEMSTYLQAKLLRFLQDFSYRRVGGTKELTADVRIISASHQNLVQLIAKQAFREDLYYRLNVLNLTLPPLRERASDIALLAKGFLTNAVKQVGRGLQAEDVYLTEPALALLQRFSWPGNIRQLQNVLFSVVALNKGQAISASDIQQVLAKYDSEHSESKAETTDQMESKEIKDWASAQAKFELELLQQLLPLYPSTRKLAERLGVSHNKIAMKLRQHGIG
ncbi:sigma 54-interacting transcriptional regulator [Litorilituus sediminis]|uniref:HTH-type transcriptional regulatory protein TyrR n=1 Tax=Litorilituus sediminis TaxID=718192 RepID=A0A4P6P099_9GAMM|nr:sigma 54-interacting transcriptional regulator [Litorilituus sediminis]QBG34243.1 AAA family ATPase [Litorilituus sediminis]